MFPHAFWLVWTTLFVIVARTTLPGHDLSIAGSMEAFMHIWVGVMIARAWTLWPDNEGKASLVALGVATLVETALFLTR